MRSLPVIGVVFPVVLLAACSTTTTSAAMPPSAAASQSCTLAMQAWLQSRGGAAFHVVLHTTSTMWFAVESGSQTRAAAEAQDMNSAARRADGYPPPACADHTHYQLAMGDWMLGALDAMSGDLKATTSRIAAGARELDAIKVLKRLAPKTLKRLARQVTVAVVATTAPVAPTTTPVIPTTAPVTPTTAPVVTSTPVASPTPTGCYPISDEGTCYEPGEYCRADDYGTSGIAGDGEAITCEDNDGWRWEPS
jgi:hypothetical protein